MSGAYDPAAEGAEMAFDGRMSYGDYLHLDRVLDAQHPISDAPDELLFIVQHQTAELWMKLAISELRMARDHVAAGRLPQAFKLLSRVARIFEQLNDAWDVLRTMTPADYTTFRGSLGQSSGFQSHQYRMIEFVLGNRNPAMIRPHAHRPEIRAALEAEMAAPSLYDAALEALARSGLAVSRREAFDAPHVADTLNIAAWAVIYRAPEAHWPLYELAEKLVDVEDYFRRWRFNHVTTVERIIGFKRGTGGTGGVTYLRRMLEVELFPDLWRVRTEL